MDIGEKPCSRCRWATAPRRQGGRAVSAPAASRLGDTRGRRACSGAVSGCSSPGWALC